MNSSSPSLESRDLSIDSVSDLKKSDLSALREHMDEIARILSSYYTQHGSQDNSSLLALHDKGRLVGAFVGIPPSEREPEPDAEMLTQILSAFEEMDRAADSMIGTLDRNHESLQEITHEIRSVRMIMSESNKASI